MKDTLLTLNLTPTERAFVKLKYKCYKEYFILKYSYLKQLYRIAMDRREFEVAEAVREWTGELYGN